MVNSSISSGWSIENWLTLIGIVVSFLGAAASSVFSYFLYRATSRSTRAAESSAAAADASTQIAKNLENQRVKMTMAMRSQLLIGLKEHAWAILEELIKIRQNEHTSTNFFNNHFRNPNISAYDLSEYFSDEDRKTINNAWSKLNILLTNRWSVFGTGETTLKIRTSVKDKSYQSDHLDTEQAFKKVTELI